MTSRRTAFDSMQPEHIADGLFLRQVESPEDMREACELLGRVFEPGVERLVGLMLEGHPALTPGHCLIVEDRHRAPAHPDGRPPVVSTITLVPQTWSLEGVPLPVANLEFVATDPAYRKRGLIRALYRWFDQAARAEGAQLSSVMGIPSFYSQFGYVYGAPLGRGQSLAVREVEDLVSMDPLRDPARRLEVRPAQPSDLDAIVALWEKRTAGLQLAGVRSRAVWEHLLKDLAGVRGQWQVVVEGDAAAPGAASVAGLFILYTPETPGQPGASASVAGLCARDYDTALEAVRWVAGMAVNLGIERVFYGLPPGSPEFCVVAGLGAREERIYGWQVRVYDWAALLGALRPVLERRLAASAYRGLTHTLVIDLYRTQIALEWRNGRLQTVREGIEISDGGAPRVRLPVDAFTQLVLGYRGLEELYATRLDVQASGSGGARVYRGLVDALFPRLHAWVEP